MPPPTTASEGHGASALFRARLFLAPRESQVRPMRGSGVSGPRCCALVAQGALHVELGRARGSMVLCPAYRSPDLVPEAIVITGIGFSEALPQQVTPIHRECFVAGLFGMDIDRFDDGPQRPKATRGGAACHPPRSESIKWEYGVSGTTLYD